MLYLSLFYLVAPSVAVATVMLYVNTLVARASARRMFGPRPTKQIVKSLPLKAPHSADDSLRFALV
jgi:hypothetical protein